MKACTRIIPERLCHSNSFNLKRNPWATWKYCSKPTLSSSMWLCYTSFCFPHCCPQPANSSTAPSMFPQADRARGRLSGYHPNGFLHGYKQPNYRPGPHINTILRTQARTEHSACVRVCATDEQWDTVNTEYRSETVWVVSIHAVHPSIQ